MPRRPRDISMAPIAVPVPRRRLAWLDLVHMVLAFYSWPMFGALAAWGFGGFRFAALIPAFLVGGMFGVAAALLTVPLAAKCLEGRPLRVVFWGVVAPTAVVAAASGYAMAQFSSALLIALPFPIVMVYAALCLFVGWARPRPKPGTCPTCGYPIADARDNRCSECGGEFAFAGQRVELPRTRCSGCGYSLEGLTTGVCPECGQEFRMSRAARPEGANRT